jgi:hypothetical protein
MSNELLTAALKLLARFSPFWCAVLILTAIWLYRLPDFVWALRN